MPRPARLRSLACALLACALTPAFMSAKTLPVFIGNYGDAIVAGDFDSADGSLANLRPVAPLAKASFLARSSDGRFLYAVAEAKVGELHAFAIGAGGALTALNVRSSEGGGACDIALSPDGRLVAAANYGGGSVIVYRVSADGSLGEKAAFFQHAHASKAYPGRQEKPHAHGVTWSADGRFLFVPDLGGDRVYIYARDLAADTLAPSASQPWFDVPAGAGPRHCQFSADGGHFYVINEMANTITVATYDPAAGTLSALENVSTLPAEGFAGATTTAEIAVSPDGRTVYASNRGADTLAVFARDLATGRLTLKAQIPVPAQPRHFALTPDARHLVVAGQKAEQVAVYTVDEHSGALAPTGNTVTTPTPVCVRF